MGTAARSVERWAGVRLWCYRATDGSMPYAVIVRSAQGGQYRDQLLARGVAPCPPGGIASTDATGALMAALVQRLGPATCHALRLRG